jgi:hypothetical protein
MPPNLPRGCPVEFARMRAPLGARRASFQQARSRRPFLSAASR